MYTYHQLLQTTGVLRLRQYEMWHCGHYAGCLVFDWQCEKKNHYELEYKVQVVS